MPSCPARTVPCSSLSRRAPCAHHRLVTRAPQAAPSAPDCTPATVPFSAINGLHASISSPLIPPLHYEQVTAAPLMASLMTPTSLSPPPSLYKRAAEIFLTSPLPKLAPISLSLSSPLEPPPPLPEFVIAGAHGVRRSYAICHPKSSPCSSPPDRTPVELSLSHVRTQG
jgi:hypothetical protein